MTKLNKSNFSLQFKKGLASNINSTATKELAIEGEPHYATDTKDLYIFDGTENKLIAGDTALNNKVSISGDTMTGGLGINLQDGRDIGVNVTGKLTTTATSLTPDNATTATLYLWLKADAITGLNDGDAVDTWTKSGGIASDATQSTAGFRPVYKTNIINTLPVVRFDGSDDKLLGSGSNTSSKTIIIVCKDNGSTQGLAGVWSNNNANGLTWLSGNFLYCDFAGASAQEAPVSTKLRSNWNIYTLVYDTNFDFISISTNGTEDNFINQDKGTTSSLYNVGVRDRTLNRHFNGDIAEIIIFNGVLSIEERANIEAYLGAKYAISMTYSHPQEAPLFITNSTTNTPNLYFNRSGWIGVGEVPTNPLKISQKNSAGAIIDINQTASWSGTQYALKVNGNFSLLHQVRIGAGGGIRDFYVTGAANFEFALQGSSNFFHISNSDGGGSGSSNVIMSLGGTNKNVGIGITSPTARLHVVGNADTQQLIIRGNSTQTANLTEWQNSSNTVLASISSSGKITTSTEIEIDGDLNHDGTNVGLYGVTPVARATTGITEVAFVENAGGTAINVDSTFDGYTLQQVVQALKDIGILT